MINQNMARRGLMGVGSGDDVLTGTAIVDSSRKVTIPLDANRKNFVAVQEFSDDYDPTQTGGIVAVLFRLNYISDTRAYSIKTNSWAATPPTIASGSIPTGYVSETANSITIQANNNNTTGLLVQGQTVRYFVW